MKRINGIRTIVVFLCMGFFFYICVFKLEIMRPNKGVKPDPYRATVFQDIYRLHRWHNGSGSGSTPQYTTQLRQHLYHFVKSYNTSSMLDIPCGVMLWTELFLNSVWKFNPHFRYIGMDITESVVRQLREKWTNEKRVSIFNADLVSYIPKIGKVDIVLNRDVIQHMPLKDGCLAVENLIHLDFNYLLIGTYPANKHNIDIKTGKFYQVNILKGPFNFPNPYMMFRERKDFNRQKYIYVYKRSDIQEHICQICHSYVNRKDCPFKNV